MTLFETENQAFETRKTLFVEIILPVPLEGTFTYRVPYELNDFVRVGSRVIVQFGTRRNVQTGIIYEITETPPTKFEAKYILELLDNEPIVNKLQFKIWQWTADYYMCSLGEVMGAGVPSGLKLSSQSRIQLHPDFEYSKENISLNKKEILLVESIQKEQALTFEEASTLLNQKNIYQIIKDLIQKEVIIIFEQIKNKYTPKKQKRVRLSQHLTTPEAIENLLQSLKTRSKQEAIVLNYLVKNPVNTNPTLNQKGIPKTEVVTAEMSQSSFKTLQKNGVFEIFEEVIPRFQISENETLKQIKLSNYQEKIASQILEDFNDFNTVLLHGITGSGKTEIYIDIIQKVLDSGSQVLFLLPEIALTAQIVIRLKRVFGSKMGVYHSKFSDNERVEIWQGVLDGTFQIVVGVRSAVWLPFSNLGLIVVDEEHDASYKQYDPAPRYNARDLSLVLAHLHQAKVLLGSATPSLESYYLASQNRYSLVVANERYANAQLPEIKLINTQKERKQKTMQGYFSSELLKEISQRLASQHQIILFQNRRGYAPQVDCHTCGWTPGCNSCSISLTYHQYSNQMRCHYCGHHEPPPKVCPACGSTDLTTKGFGTQQIEDELKNKFPATKIQRMDLDTTRQKNSYQHIIEDFANQKTEVLVGTQMVTKGLDFDHVSLVGVFDTDRMLHFPDFRSHERTFQLLVQVSGRAGRREKAGLVLIQTGNPQSEILQKVKNHDYEAFYKSEIKERERFFYPPFTRIIRLTVKNTDHKITEEAAVELAQKLREQLGESRVLGPESPLIDRIRTQYLKVVSLKLERDKINLKKVKNLIQNTIREITISKQYKKLVIAIDVDPM